MKISVYSVLLVLTFTTPAMADQYDDAIVAYDAQDYATAWKLLKPLDMNGDKRALNDMGHMYFNGLGVPQNYEEALKLFKRSAKKGYPNAQRHIGEMYLNGQGLPKDSIEAKKWMQMAADQGERYALLELAEMIENEKAADDDLVGLHVWFNLATSAFSSAAPSEWEYRDRAFAGRDRIASKMSAEQISEAQKLAAIWKPKKN